MLHHLKRTAGRAQQPLKGPANAEYMDLRQRLSTIKSALVYTSQMLDYSNKGWVMQMQAQRTFSERFVESYPVPGEEMHVIAEQFAAGSQKLYDHFIRKASPDMKAIQHIHHQVTIYIREIDSVESYHSRLIAAKSEADRYQSKIDAMERKGRAGDDEKKTRNLMKMDVEKGNYKKLLNEVVTLQKKTYAKYPVVFKAALVSYWLSHEKHVTMLVESLRETQAFAKEAEAEMAGLDIKKLALEYEYKGPNLAQTNSATDNEERKRDKHLNEMSRSLNKMELKSDGSLKHKVQIELPPSEETSRSSSRLVKAKSAKSVMSDKVNVSQTRSLSKARSMTIQKLRSFKASGSGSSFGSEKSGKPPSGKDASLKASVSGSSSGSDKSAKPPPVKKDTSLKASASGSSSGSEKSAKPPSVKDTSLKSEGSKRSEVRLAKARSVADEGLENEKSLDVDAVEKEAMAAKSASQATIGRGKSMKSTDSAAGDAPDTPSTNEIDSDKSFTKSPPKKEKCDDEEDDSSGDFEQRTVNSMVGVYESGVVDRAGRKRGAQSSTGLKDVLTPNKTGL